MRMTPAYSFTLETEAIAKALAIPESGVMSAFCDGRVASRFSELWAAKCFGVIAHKSSNQRSSDGFFPTPDGDRVEIAIRTLTRRGIRFQDSIYMGGGRSCSMRQLKESIRRSDKWYVCDITGFPTIAFYKIKASLLEQWIDDGVLSTSGLSAEKFAMLLNRDATPMLRQLELV